jgi:metal-responsive CopG/Arc/MetJ family transcriptional regulator
MKHHIGLTIDADLFREIENLKGMTKRSTFMEHLLRLGLKAYKTQQPKTQQQPEPILNSKGESYE